MGRSGLNTSITAKVTEPQHEAFAARAKAHGLSVSEYARHILLNEIKTPENGGVERMLRVVCEELASMQAIQRRLGFLIASGAATQRPRPSSLRRPESTIRHRPQPGVSRASRVNPQTRPAGHNQISRRQR